MSTSSTSAMLRRGHLLKNSLARPTATPYICWKCQYQNRRPITQNFLKRKEEGRKLWEQWAIEIRAGERESMLSILEKRGFVQALAGERSLIDKILTDKRIGVYCGIDPTAPSLHAGHMISMMVLFWMYLHGYHACSLIGGTTAAIGDPTGRTTSRTEITSAERKANIAAMHYQIKRLWVNLEAQSKKYGFLDRTHHKRELTNNGVWWNKTSFLEVIKIMGRGLRLSTMLSRDTVKSRLESGDGMAFSEFCYPIFQSWDFWRLYEEKGIQMQIGGQDQFGNIVSGIEAVKYIAKSHPDPVVRAPESGMKDLMTPIGLTVPLLTTASGEKFGKSAGNAVWLDSQMTSAFDLYGFFVRTSDDDVEKYLKLFTFLPLKEIQSLVDKHKTDPSKRAAQHTLAYEFVELVHGKQTAVETKAQHAAIYEKKLSLSSVLAQSALGISTPQTPDPAPQNPLQENQNAQTRLKGTFVSSALNKFAPQSSANTDPTVRVVLPKSLIYEQPIARVLYAAGLVTSRSEGHRLAEAQGAYIGHKAGVSTKKGSTQMDDQLSFTPAKMHDKAMSWRYVIRDEEYGGPDDMKTPGEEGVLILRVGKWKIRVCRIVSDELFETLGLPDPPGYAQAKAEQSARLNKQLLEEEVRPKKHESRRDNEAEAVREQQEQAMEYFAQQGVNPRNLKDAIWQRWDRAGAKNAESDSSRDPRGSRVRDTREQRNTYPSNAGHNNPIGGAAISRGTIK